MKRLFSTYGHGMTVAQAIAALKPIFAFQILEKPSEILFEKFDAEVDFDAYHSGRLFAESLELRWRKRANGHHLLLMADNLVVEKEALGFENELTGFETDYEVCLAAGGQPQPTYYFLWGEFNTDVDGWLEERIPRVLDYPLAKEAGIPAIEVVEYQNKTSGQVEFVRYKSVKMLAVEDTKS